MEKVLELYKYIDGLNDAKFPNDEEQVVVRDFRYDAKRMGGAPTISFSIKHSLCLDNLWDDHVYAMFNGERYYVKQTPTSSYSNEDTRYKHEVELISERTILDNVYFYDVVTTDVENDKPVSNSSKFSFFGDIHEYVKRVGYSLSWSGLDYTIEIDENIVSEEKQVSFENQVITSVLQEIYNIYQIPYYFDGKVIHVGYYKNNIDNVFKYGSQNSLLSISKTNANAKIVNRITGVGSQDNIPYYYPNNDEKGITRPLLNDSTSGVQIVSSSKYRKIRLSDRFIFNKTIQAKTSLIDENNYTLGDLRIGSFKDEKSKFIVDFLYSFTLKQGENVEFSVTSSYEDNVGLSYDMYKKGGNYIGPFVDSSRMYLSSGEYSFVVRWSFMAKGTMVEIEEKLQSLIATYLNIRAHIDINADNTWTLNGIPVSLEHYGLQVDNPNDGDVVSIEQTSYINPQSSLMPPIYRDTLGKERFYNALNDTYVDEESGGNYKFENEYAINHPKEHIEVFEDIKPTIKNVTNKDGYRIDRFVDFAYDLHDNDEVDENGKYIHRYFFAKLHKFDGDFGFNLFNHSIDEDEMIISMTSGSCGSCSFKIMVSDTQENTVQVDEYGNLLRDNNGNVRFGSPQATQNDTENYEVWIALEKDIQTFGVIMPNASNHYRPSSSDTFVILHIDLPKAYIEAAEKKLEKELIKYMYENNFEKFNFSISFSRIFFAEQPNILANLTENSKLNVEYNGNVYELYVSSLSYTMNSSHPLPEIKVELDDVIAISQNQISQIVASTRKEILAVSNQDVFWKDIKGVPSWITSEKPQYSYNELHGRSTQHEDGVWVVKTDANGSKYIFSTYPVVTQYGITMYAEGGDLDIPSIYNGLPIDNETLYWENVDGSRVLKAKGGGGVADSVAWINVDGKPLWITDTKPTYSYSEIEGTPDLSGYATETYVEDRLDDLINGAPAAYDTLKEIADVLAGNVDSIGDIITTLGAKADKATTLAGYGITDAYTKTKVDELLGNYVTLATKQIITGEKNFTGGLKVNGSPIVYDATNKYWKLEGDLLVTGGVTMYASDSSFTPSTIMNAIATDGVNLQVVNGVLTFVGKTGGGVADSVLWDNIEGKPSWIGSSKPSYSYSEISGTPTLLSSFIDDVGFATSSALSGYMSLSGGQMTGSISFLGYHYLYGDVAHPMLSDANGFLSVYHIDNATILGAYGDGTTPNIATYIRSTGNNLYHRQGNYKAYKDYRIWDEGNDGAGSGLDADLLDGYDSSDFVRCFRKSVDLNTPINDNNAPFILRIGNINENPNTPHYYATLLHVSRTNADTAFELLGAYDADKLRFRRGTWKKDGSGTIFANPWKEIAFIDSNVASASKLETARTIWGQSFDGTGNVNGHLTLLNNRAIYSYDSAGVARSLLYLSDSDTISIGYDTSGAGYDTHLNGNNILFRYGTSHTEGMRITSTGNVLIGITSDRGCKLDVTGSIYANNYNASGNSSVASIIINKSGNPFGIGTSNNKENIRFGVCKADATWISEWMTITNGGKIGINQTSPKYYLDVNGNARIDSIPIYKSQDDVLYIDGNLAVRGGITMYATDAIDVPSIIEALPPASYSDKGIASFNPNDFSVVDGYVSFIGKGGVDESVLADYLPLSGGTLESSTTRDVLNINSTMAFGPMFHLYNGTQKITSFGHIPISGDNHYGSFWVNNEANVGILLGSDSKAYITMSAGGLTKDYTILHSGNWSQFVTAGDGGNYLPLSGGTISGGFGVLTIERNEPWACSIEYKNTSSILGYLGFDDDFKAKIWDKNKSNAKIIAFESSNVASATKLQTPRTIWGQSFDGTGDVNGMIYVKVSSGHITADLKSASSSQSILAYTKSNGVTWSTGVGVRDGGDSFGFWSTTAQLCVLSIDISGNVLSQGGITMYSDIRKKTKLQDVELTLQQIAEAPLIEHYYNSDTNKTTHVGSIAQYWAELNDWFCKLDKDGYYTMEIQNAALASAISIARELVKYESKTDKEIRMLKDEVKRLKKEIKILKSA